MKKYPDFGSEKTKPIKLVLSSVEWSQNRPLAGNPKHEARNPKRVERVHLKKQSQSNPIQTQFCKGEWEKPSPKPEALRLPPNKMSRNGRVCHIRLNTYCAGKNSFDRIFCYF